MNNKKVFCVYFCGVVGGAFEFSNVYELNLTAEFLKS